MEELAGLVEDTLVVVLVDKLLFARLHVRVGGKQLEQVEDRQLNKQKPKP